MSRHAEHGKVFCDHSFAFMAESSAISAFSLG